jgi:4-amino-4-deoxy-L-arabinose transferase-like glycosyltransferase
MFANTKIYKRLGEIINHRSFIYILFVIVFLTFASIYIRSYQQKSATFDEAVILYSGTHFLYHGETRINAENPLLGKSLLALPTLFMDIRLPAEPEKNLYSYQMQTGFNSSRKFLYADNDADKILFWCRMMNVVLTFACALFVYFFLRLLMKRNLAFLGMIIFLLSPTITANGRLATVDTAVMFFMFGAVYFLFRALRSGKTVWALFAGIMTAGAMLSKFTGILLLPIILLQLLAYFLHKRDTPALLTAAKFFGIIIIISLLLINSCYLFKETGYSLENCGIRSPLLTKFSSIRVLNSIPVPLPLGYIKGFDIVAYNNKPGFPNIFMGKYYPQGGSWWYYYLLVSVMKIPIAFLILIAAGMFFAASRFYRRWEYYFIIIPPLVIFFNFSFVAYRQLGIRYLLPVFPFLAISSIIAVKYMLRCRKGKLRLPVTLLLIWLVMTNILVYPHYLAYFNAFAGGSEGGKNYLASSNLDWGQDLPGLKKWQEKMGNPLMYTFYFGQGDPGYYGIKNSGKPEYVAISVTYMYLCKADGAFSPQMKQYLEDILKTVPVGSIGHSIYIYKALKGKKRND